MLVLAAVVLLVAGSLPRYPGSLWVLVAFHLAFFVLAILAVLPPYVDAYVFLTGFMVLGFWVKLMAHLLLGFRFAEPVGAFDYSPAQWDRALTAAAAAAAGAALFRLGYLLAVRRKVVGDAPPSAGPGWYHGRPVEIWALAAFLTLILYLVNFRFAFFQIGVVPKLTLPPGLNAVVAWMVFAGGPLAWTLLAEWELARRPERFAPLVWSVCLLALVASVSTASRGTTIFLFAAYGCALALHRPGQLRKLVQTWRWRLPVVLTATLALSLTLVSVFRMTTYVLPRGTLDGNEMARQVLTLPVARWVGLEGLLSVSASTQRSLALLVEGIREDPKRGVHSIYQKLAGSPYEARDGFIYLTLPGAPAILYYSGSVAIVLAGMCFFTAALTAVEALAARVTSSRFLVALLGVLTANAVSQMSFPYLWMVFMAETLVALGAFALVQSALRLAWRQGGVRHKGNPLKPFTGRE
ncbi:MAG: hypothetical protein QN141_11545 [Armatimonadota bacterium]|nr:hypothetical protein [Armatimonadota bacterium]MDR7452002.1 hypothetical protein [Armatimonadota bacterium]MDR7467893.1 hypothetical protein [Armatimonadota bacterium]MDR7494254.1 hypothetical protein [Armatimonadota bacterium]MDR7500035.1 hypothetical protein [Armatimonadota bacterium]